MAGGDDSSRVSSSSSPSPPWSKIVTPSEFSESIVKASSDSCPPEMAIAPGDSECQTECSDNAVKKAGVAWNTKPLNGDVGEEVVTSSVMDADLWPPLGESAKTAPKSSSSSESLPPLSLFDALQVTENSSDKPATVNNANTTTSATNNVAPSVQRSTKRGGGAYVSSNGVVTLRSPVSHEAPHTTSGKPVTVAVDTHPKDKDSLRGNDHHYQRGTFRRGGNAGYNHNYGGRVDQGRGNQEWNQHRNFNNMQPHRGGYRRGGGYIRPSVHNSPPIIPPMHMPSPFANNFIYPGPDAMIYFQGPAQPMVPGPPYLPFPDPVLHGKILNQINYYFSNENLVKDTFLRRNMDEHGWVSVNLIAGFNKVLSMTDDVQLILHVMQASNLVEVQGDKLRRRNDWMRWLLPPVGQDLLGSQLQGIGLSSSSSRSSSSGELQQGGVV